MDEFTNEEKRRIDLLYGNDFQDITPEDAQLIGRWEAFKAVNESKHQAELKAIEDEAQEKALAARLESEQTLANLQELHDMAIARFKAVSNGK